MNNIMKSRIPMVSAIIVVLFFLVSCGGGRTETNVRCSGVMPSSTNQAQQENWDQILEDWDDLLEDWDDLLDSWDEYLDVLETRATNHAQADWDQVLNEYEKFVDSYISLMRRVSSGDISALSYMADVLESAERLFSRLDNARGDMTTSQVSRLLRLQQRKLESVMNL